MFKRISFFKIIKDHLGTLRDVSSSKNTIPFSDIFLFFLLPFFVGLYMALNNFDLYDHLSDLITAIAILCGFLFNLLGVIYGLMDKFKAEINEEDSDDKIKKIFIKQIHINISFDILISIILLILLIVYAYIPNNSCTIWNEVLLTLVYFFLIQFFLSLLMVLNRVYILMKKNNE